MINDETLFAYADDELGLDRRREVEEDLRRDPELLQSLRSQQALKQRLKYCFDPVLDEDLPPRLVSLLAVSTASVVPIRKAQRFDRSWWNNVSALAAALLVGLAVGLFVQPEDGGGRGDSLASGEVAEALETQLASTQSADERVKVGVTFVGPEDRLCRTFQGASSAGLACREDQSWRLLLVAPTVAGSSTEYQLAGSGASLIMEAAQGIMSGDALDATKERAARDGGWSTKAVESRTESGS